MKSPKNILLYHGTKGCGKTRFCSSLMEWIFTTFNSFRIWREIDLLSRLREGISDGEGDYTKNLLYLTDDDLIILDDVGSWLKDERSCYSNPGWKVEVFFNFLDTRYNNMKPTIITSNLTSEQFLEVYGERVWDRLFARENKFMALFGEGLSQRQKGR